MLLGGWWVRLLVGVWCGLRVLVWWVVWVGFSGLFRVFALGWWLPVDWLCWCIIACFPGLALFVLAV